MSRNAKISAGLIIVVVAAVVGLFAWSAQSAGDRETPPGPSTQAAAPTDARVVRDDSHVLGKPGTTGVTLVEFLDFECEGCRAAYPFVEQLRTEYAGKVTFVARYFPLPGHANGMNAALAVEAAAQQGKFEDMYKKMYETQESWGDQQTDHSATFRGFAQELGLDLAEYDATVAAPASEQRIRADIADGTALGIQGTPTFFLQGKKLEPASMDDFRNALDDALAAAS